MNQSPPVARKVVALHHTGIKATEQPTTTLSQSMLNHLLQLDTLARHLIFFLVLLPSLIVLGLLFGGMPLPVLALLINAFTVSLGSWLLALGFALASLLLAQDQHSTQEHSPATLTQHFNQLFLKKRYLLAASSLLSFFASALLVFSLLLSSL